MRKRHRPAQSSDRLRRLLVELASLRADSVDWFLRRWGDRYGQLSSEEVLRRRDELRVLWRFVARKRVRPQSIIDVGFDFSEVDEVIPDADYPSPPPANLAQEWEAANSSRPLPEYIAEGWLHQGEGLCVLWEKRRLVPHPRSLSAALAMAAWSYSRRLAVCWNPECPAPYFLASRNNQRYCSDGCTVVAKREAKRKWWSKHRAKRKSSKSKRERRKRR